MGLRPSHLSRTYLASNLQKTVFAEHAVDEDDGKKGKKKAGAGGVALLGWSDTCGCRTAKPGNKGASLCVNLNGFSPHVKSVVHAQTHPAKHVQPFRPRRVDQDERVNVSPTLQDTDSLARRKPWTMCLRACPSTFTRQLWTNSSVPEWSHVLIWTSPRARRGRDQPLAKRFRTSMAVRTAQLRRATLVGTRRAEKWMRQVVHPRGHARDGRGSFPRISQSVGDLLAPGRRVDVPGRSLKGLPWSPHSQKELNLLAMLCPACSEARCLQVEQPEQSGMPLGVNECRAIGLAKTTGPCMQRRPPVDPKSCKHPHSRRGLELVLGVSSCILFNSVLGLESGPMRC